MGFGGSQKIKIKMPKPKIDAGGLKGKAGKISATGERTGLVGQIASTFPEQANLTAGLRERVAPGVSDLRQSRLAEVESARQRSVGNLRENLARRRVLGSSFGADALARTEAEFAKEADRVQAETFLQELELTNQLINQEYALRRGEAQTFLDDLNLQAEVATQLASGMTAQLGANARLEAQLAAQSASGTGSFFGLVGQGIGSAVGGPVGGIIGGGIGGLVGSIF